MITQLTFDAPAPLLNLNDRMSWRPRGVFVEAWRRAAWAAAVQIGQPAVRRRPASWVTVSLPVADRRRRDPHNFAPTMKAIIDGLVDAGVWPDDTPEYVTTTEPVLDVQQLHRGRGLSRSPGLVTVTIRDRAGSEVPG